MIIQSGTKSWEQRGTIRLPEPDGRKLDVVEQLTYEYDTGATIQDGLEVYDEDGNEVTIHELNQIVTFFGARQYLGDYITHNYTVTDSNRR